MRIRHAVASFLVATGLAVAAGAQTPSAADQQNSLAPSSGLATPRPLTLSDPATATATEPQMLVDHANAGAPYRGGRGLITLQGMSGMFLNPTSGTLDKGQITAQYCLLIDKFDLNSVVGHGLMVSYGVTDWLELGMFGTVAEINGVDRRIINDPIGVAGPIARVRLMKQDGYIPEVAIGGMYVDGGSEGDLLYRAEGFIAASELFPLDTDGTFRSLRVHAGSRYVGRSEANGVGKDAAGHLIFPKFGTFGPGNKTLGTTGDFCLIYGGLELELPYSLYLVGEVSSNNLLKQGGVKLPYAAGIQWKPNNVLGISVAYSNPELLGLQRGFWFGVGLTFKI
jgi:hypothetical protein